MITILAVGKIKQQFIKDGINEFLKRIPKIKYQEISKLTKIEGYVIALEESGKQYTSPQFANHLKKLNLENKNISFLIGEAAGIPKNFPRNETLSLSKMTFPTQIARLLFVEQLYRAFTLIENKPYHKV